MTFQNVRGDRQPNRSTPIPPGNVSSDPLSEEAGTPRTTPFCSQCFARVGTTYRADGSGWWCWSCSALSPVMCESCGQRPAAIVEHGYSVCGAYKSRGKTP